MKKTMTNTKDKKSKNSLDSLDYLARMVIDDKSGSYAHRVLGKLAEKLGASEFGVSYRRDDDPQLRAGFFRDATSGPSHPDFQFFHLNSIRKGGKPIAEDRYIALWNLSELYERSPIEFKSEALMTLGEYAFWMRASLRDVEVAFCQEVLQALMKYVKHDPKWRMLSFGNEWNEWAEIDPWEFAVEVDLCRRDAS